MAAKDPDKRPIIIKKIKKGGHGHHGGAWKVAYADFVTAMMAFFLLLWLIASSSKAKLDGIAEYFTPTVGLKDAMGIGFQGGTTAEMEGIRKSDKAPPGIVAGQTPTGQTPEQPKKTAQVEGSDESQLFEKAEMAIKQAFESDPTLRELSDNIIVEQTPEGLKLELQDTDKHPMFVTGRAELTDDGRKLIAAMKGVIVKLPNYISITGHTDAISGGNANYTNWELSSDRAMASRRFLLSSGLEPSRVRKMVAMGDAELLDPEDPRNPRNRRISIILLRGTHMALPDSAMPTGRDILRNPGSGGL